MYVRNHTMPGNSLAIGIGQVLDVQSQSARCTLVALRAVRLLVVVGVRETVTENVCQGMERIPTLVNARHGSFTTA